MNSRYLCISLLHLFILFLYISSSRLFNRKQVFFCKFRGQCYYNFIQLSIKSFNHADFLLGQYVLTNQHLKSITHKINNATTNLITDFLPQGFPMGESGNCLTLPSLVGPFLIWVLFYCLNLLWLQKQQEALRFIYIP